MRGYTTLQPRVVTWRLPCPWHVAEYRVRYGNTVGKTAAPRTLHKRAERGGRGRDALRVGPAPRSALLHEEGTHSLLALLERLGHFRLLGSGRLVWPPLLLGSRREGLGRGRMARLWRVRHRGASGMPPPPPPHPPNLLFPTLRPRAKLLRGRADTLLEGAGRGGGGEVVGPSCVGPTGGTGRRRSRARELDRKAARPRAIN